MKGRESSLSLPCLPGWGGYHVRFKGILQIVCVFIVTPTFFFSPKRALMAMILVLSLLWSFQIGQSKSQNSEIVLKEIVLQSSL